MSKVAHIFVCLLVVFTACQLISCGGGGPSSPPPAPPPPPAGDFSLVVNVPSLTLQQQGASQPQGIAAATTNGFNRTIDLTISGLPTGVAVTPNNIPPLPTTGVIQSSSFQLTATTNAPIGTSTITVTGTSGSITHTATFALTVTKVAPFAIHLSPDTLNLSPNSNATVEVSFTADAGASPELFVSAPLQPAPGIEITGPGFILDSSRNPVELVIRPGSFAQPLNNLPITVLANDQNNSVNTSTAILSLTVAVPSAPTSPTRSTFIQTDQDPTGMVYDQMRKLLFVSVETLNQVAVFSSVDGHRVATIPVPYPAGIDEAADGSAIYVVSPYFSYVTIIDPTLLQVVRRTNIPQLSEATIQTGFQIATLSNGKVMILLANSDPNGPPTYVWDPSNDNFTRLGDRSFAAFDEQLARSADHSRVLVHGLSNVIYDVASDSLSGHLDFGGGILAFNRNGTQVASFGLQNDSTVFYDNNGNALGSATLDIFPFDGMVYSLDGSRLYVIGDDLFSGIHIVEVIDTTTFKVIGTVPSTTFNAFLPFSGLVNRQFAVDETNMLFGPASAGVQAADISSPAFFGIPIFNAGAFNPTLLSLSSSTQTALSGNFPQGTTYAITFGAPPGSAQTRKATNVTAASNGLQMTAPAGLTAGPANVTVTRSDGFFEIVRDAVSFGPSALIIDTNAGSSNGGEPSTIFGYGFDANTQVTIGGRVATNVTVFGPFGNSPLQSINFKTPLGTPGNADVTISNSKGSTSIPAGFQYLASSQLYPRVGALDDIVYDRARQRLYASNEDHNRIEIFDLGTHSYLNPISVGSSPTSIALTPDGTRLAVVNADDDTMSVIDLSTSTVVTTLDLLPPQDTQACNEPLSMAPVKPHRMLVNFNCPGTLDGGLFRLVNLDTGSMNCTGVAGCNPSGTDLTFGNCCGAGVPSSVPDGSKVFIAPFFGGQLAMFDFDANTITYGFEGTFSDSAASADGTIFAASLGIADDHVSRRAIMSYEPHAIAVREHTVAGEKLHPSGSLLYLPQDYGVQIFDVHTGRLLRDITLPEPIPYDMNGMELDETGTKMFLISDTGITIAELSVVPLSVATVTPATGSVGTQVKIRGSGFQNGAAVKFNQTQGSATFVDESTLLAVVPGLPSGGVQVTVTNPDGKSYSFDAAFDIE